MPDDARPGHDVDTALERPDPLLREGQQRPAGRRQRDPAPVALDDGGAEEVTEPGQGPADGRLRHAEDGGRGRHLADLGDDDEDGQQPHDGPELGRSHALIV